MRKLRNKAILGAVAIAALTGGGAALAAGPFTDEDGEAIIDDAAERLGVEPTELTEALQLAYAAQVDAAVAAGELTEAQGTELKERIEAGDVPLVGGPLLHGPGHGHGPHFGGLEAAASYLGLDEDALRERLHDGETLAEIAEAEGKTVDGLEQALLDAAKADLAEAVADGRLTEDQQQDILDTLPDRIAAFVAGERPDGPPAPRAGDDAVPAA